MSRNPFDDVERERALDRDAAREPRLPRQTTFPRRFTQAAVGPRDSSDRCYACDARAVGTRDRRAEGGRVERACARHTDLAGVQQPPVKTGGAR